MASEEPAETEEGDRKAVPHRAPPAPVGRAAHTARDVDFPMALRGYDRAAVDRYVEEVNQAIAELEISSSPQSAIRHALEQVSEETSGLLQRAHETADEITARSRTQADDRLERAQSEADEVREAAAQDAADTRAKVARETEAMKAQAEAHVDELRRNADAIAEERRGLIEELRDAARSLVELADQEEARFAQREEVAAEEPPTEKIEAQPELD
jgi:DivIVA domain-containing protein